MNWDSIPGFFLWREGQEQFVRDCRDGAVAVEVGLFLGRSVCSLGQLVRDGGKRITVVGVDHCRGSGDEGGRSNHDEVVARNGGSNFAGELVRNVNDCGLADVVTVVVADSETASRLFADGSIDWVHIDGGHDYDSVARDLRCWWPKVRRGGQISGDDYLPRYCPGVVRAVDEFLPRRELWLLNQWRAVKE